jgi:hypothetical protein
MELFFCMGRNLIVIYGREMDDSHQRTNGFPLKIWWSRQNLRYERIEFLGGENDPVYFHKFIWKVSLVVLLFNALNSVFCNPHLTANFMDDTIF